MSEFHELLILMVVIWTAGKIFRNLGLPIVFGELLGGVFVGPLMLNVVSPESHTIEILAELGIFFLMLHAGLHTDHEEILQSSFRSIGVAIAGFLITFLSGFGVSQFFGQSMEVSLFIGMSISITAIVLAARMLKDYKLQKSRIAHIVLGAAITDKIIAFLLFSVVLGIVEQGSVDIGQILWLVCKVLLFFAIVIYGGLKIAPILNRFIYFGNKGFTLTLIIALCMGLISEAIGLHIIIGAFLAGLFIHQNVIDEKTFHKIEDRVYGLSYSFFGPIFFASLAFHLDFTAFTTAPYFLIAIILVAFLGKFLGSGGLSLLLGMKQSEAITVGLMMNIRGTVELIIASIGLQQGIIDQTVFSILVIMAFATTLLSILMTGAYMKSQKNQLTSALVH